MRLARAGVAELIQMLDAADRFTLQPEVYGRLLAQVALSQTCAVFGDGEEMPAAVAGIFPLPGQAGEIWFMARPEGLGRLAVPAVKAARRVLACCAAAYPGGLMCLVRDGHRPGERLARAIGCVPQSVLLDNAREWTWAHELTQRHPVRPHHGTI